MKKKIERAIEIFNVSWDFTRNRNW
jgi:hypothetical protein